MGRREPKTLVRLLHTSDAHLGWDSIFDLTKRAFTAMVDRANYEKVDLVLICGDLFDYNRVTHGVVDFAVSELNRLKMPIILLPGNHDVYDATSIYHQIDIEGACRNLKLITEPQGETVTIDQYDLALWGKAMEEHHPGFSPLGDAMARNGTGWFIGMAHGHFCPDNRNPFKRSSPIMASEIAASSFDYIALGHWHIFTDVSQNDTKAFYSGSPAGAGFEKRLGDVNIVTLDPLRGVLVEHQSLDPSGPRRDDDDTYGKI